MAVAARSLNRFKKNAGRLRPGSEAERFSSVPERRVDIVNNRDGSLRSCHYALTDEEANALRNDPRIYSVEIPPEQRDDIRIGLRGVQRGNFNKTSSSAGNGVNWGLKRINVATNNSHIYFAHSSSTSAGNNDTYGWSPRLYNDAGTQEITNGLIELGVIQIGDGYYRIWKSANIYNAGNLDFNIGGNKFNQ